MVRYSMHRRQRYYLQSLSEKLLRAIYETVGTKSSIKLQQYYNTDTATRHTHYSVVQEVLQSHRCIRLGTKLVTPCQ